MDDEGVSEPTASDHPDVRETGRHRDRQSPRPRSIALIVSVVAVVCLGSGIVIGAEASGGAAGTVSPPRLTSVAVVRQPVKRSFLYVVDGTSGSAVVAGPAPWRLTLSGATVLWFEDRPLRGSGQLPLDQFVAGWATDFPGSSPVGAVVAPAGPPGHTPTAIQLSDPVADPATGTVTFTVTPDRGESAADTAWLSALTPATAAEHGRVVLFVDDGSGTYSGLTDSTEYVYADTFMPFDSSF